MQGVIRRARGYGQDGFELAVTIAFDAVQFNKIKKSQNDPLQDGMAQIKNVVLDAVSVRGTPSYSRFSMRQAYPRAKNGLVTLTVYFDVSRYTAESLGVNTSDFCLYHVVDLNTTLEATRQDGHLLAKTALAAALGH